MKSDLYLTTEEVRFISGERNAIHQEQALMQMGYEVVRRPNGTFWVPRQQFLDHKGRKKKPPKLMLDDL